MYNTVYGFYLWLRGVSGRCCNWARCSRRACHGRLPWSNPQATKNHRTRVPTKIRQDSSTHKRTRQEFFLYHAFQCKQGHLRNWSQHRSQQRYTKKQQRKLLQQQSRKYQQSSKQQRFQQQQQLQQQHGRLEPVAHFIPLLTFTLLTTYNLTRSRHSSGGGHMCVAFTSPTFRTCYLRRFSVSRSKHVSHCRTRHILGVSYPSHNVTRV